MNIAILIPGLGGGGAERVAQILGDYYVERGEQVFYFLQDMDIRQDYPVKGKIIKTAIQSCAAGNNTTDIEQMKKLMKSSLQMRKLKRQYGIDVAISFMEECNYINVLSKGRERVIVRVCTVLSERKEWVGFLYRKRVVRLFYSLADKVVVLSRYAREDMHGYYGVPQKKIIRIPNAVKSERVRTDDSGWEFGTKVFVCMGRLEGVKQQDRIIRAFSYVVSHEEQSRLLILGRGPNLNYLKKLCECLEIEDKVVFVGFTDQTERYLCHSRAFVIASKVEGFPNSMIEAMSCGVPVITTDSPGACGEIIGKPRHMEEVHSIMFCPYGILTPRMPNEKVRSNGLLTEQEILLGKAMLKVLMKDELFEKYREQSLKRAQTYSLDKVIDKWNDLVDGEYVHSSKKDKL